MLLLSNKDCCVQTDIDTTYSQFMFTGSYVYWTMHHLDS